jgi:hypothetical protein
MIILASMAKPIDRYPKLARWRKASIMKAFFMTDRKLAVFETDEGITFSFGERIYVAAKGEPFYNIARKALAKEDYVPFYVEMAKREGLGEEFRDSLLDEMAKLQGKQSPEEP